MICRREDILTFISARLKLGLASEEELARRSVDGFEVALRYMRCISI